MRRIIAVQHTQSVHHTNGMVGSWTDWELTDTGRADARGIGSALKKKLEGEDVILYSSDLKRAAKTSEIIGEYLGISPVLKRELRERNLGRCCGKSVQWLRENLECQERTVDDRLFSDAESRRDEWNRLKPFFDCLMQDPHETVIVVSHGDLLDVLFAMFLGLPVESLAEKKISGFPGAVTELTANGSGERLVRRLVDIP